MRKVLAWEDVVAAQARLDAAERLVGDALAALAKEKVPVAQMVTLTGIGRPQCARLLRLAVTQANAAPPGLSQRSAVTWAGSSGLMRLGDQARGHCSPRRCATRWW